MINKRIDELRYPHNKIFLIVATKLVNGPIKAPTRVEIAITWFPTPGLISVLLNTAFETIGITGTPGM